MRGLGAASIGWSAGQRRLAVAALLLLPTVFGLANTDKRAQALEYYDRAVAARLGLADGNADVPAWLAVIQAFRSVYFTTPATSKADDSLIAVAELYTEMSERFGNGAYLAKAAEAYQFLIREYPASPLLAQARQKLAELEARLASAKSDDLPVAKTETVRAVEAPAEATRSGLAQVTDVRFWSYPGLTRVVVSLEADIRPRGDRLANPDRVYFDLPKTKLAAALKGKSLLVEDTLAKRIRVAQTQLDTTRVVVDLKDNQFEYRLSTLANPPRVVLELRQGDARTPAAPEPALAAKTPPATRPAEIPAAAPAPAAPQPQLVARAAQVNSSGQPNLIRALGLKVARVVLDAGHGGHDTGTIGPTGLMEKDLTLDLAMRLGALISERLGSEVIYTREDDTFVALEERTALANAKQADLFVSVHANSSRVRGVRGIETYYLNFTADREALDVAARENATSQKSIHDLQDLVKKITLTEKIAESREFALQIQRSLHRNLSKGNVSLRNRGVRKAPFVVLIGAQMPSVLAEVSFLSNPTDERLLKTEEYRQKMAEALYDGIAGYAQTLSRVEVASN